MLAHNAGLLLVRTSDPEHDAAQQRESARDAPGMRKLQRSGAARRLMPSGLSEPLRKQGSASEGTHGRSAGTAKQRSDPGLITKFAILSTTLRSSGKGFNNLLSLLHYVYTK